MRFSVIYLTPIPDVEIGRRLNQLSDLNDKAVGKILFHRRKEEIGEQADVRLVQKRIAAAGVIQATPEGLSVITLDAERSGESKVLQTLFNAATGNDRLVTWGGTVEDLPLLHYRALRHRVAAPRYWQLHRNHPEYHLDLREVLCDQNPEAATSLDELSRILGQPGLFDFASLDLWENWLAGRRELLLQRTEIAVFNLYLLALRVMAMTGELSQSDAARGELALREELRGEQPPHRRRFRELWQA